MKLHTVFITYNRLELTKQAISSYLETVSRPWTAWVVDNASTDGTGFWLLETFSAGKSLLKENRYPGFATNLGWERAPDDATHLHRADNDFIFLPGWCEEVERVFEAEKVGQVGLRTGEEENASTNVGGNCVIRRELWDMGLRYSEEPWTNRTFYPPGYTEDSYFSPAVKALGYTWTRVRRPCIQPISSESEKDEYYRKSWADRGIVRSP